MHHGTVDGPAFPVRREQRLLQDVLEHAPASRYEINGARGRFPGEEQTQHLEILAGKKAGRGDVCYHACGFGPPHGDVSEYAVEVGVTVKAAPKPPTLLGSQLNAPIRRISDDEIEQIRIGLLGQRIANAHDLTERRAWTGQIVQRDLEPGLGKPRRERINIEPAQAPRDRYKLMRRR